MVASLNRVSLSGILGRHQIVGDRNDGEQNQKQQSQGDPLLGPAHALHVFCRSAAQPQAHHASGQDRPRYIEKKFHSLSRF